MIPILLDPVLGVAAMITDELAPRNSTRRFGPPESWMYLGVNFSDEGILFIADVM